MFLATTTAANGGVMSTGMLIMWLVIMFVEEKTEKKK